MEDINTQLTINDIALARDIIDTAVKRGAFGAAEAKQVGTLYEKIDQFIKAAIAQAEAEAESQPEAGVPNAPETSTTQGE
jgi:hypothetical protein